MTEAKTKKSLFSRLLPLLIVALAVGMAAALIASKPKAKPVEVTEKAWLVAVEQVAPQRLAPNLTLYGKVESLWSTQLTAGITADVNEVLVIEGDTVSKGQVLLRLDERDARLTLAQREAELAEAEAKIASEMTRHEANLASLPREKRLLTLVRNEVKRLENLVSKKVGARSSLDSARQAVERQAISLAAREQAVREHKARLAETQAKLARATALRDQAALDLERTQITSPYNGTVSGLLVSPGKRVRSGDALVQIYDNDALVVRAQVPNRHLGTIRAAKRDKTAIRVTGTIDGLPVNARLRSLAGEVAEGSGGIDGIFEIETQADVLQQGRFVRLELTLPAMDELVALPHEALYGTDRVYRLDEDRRMQSLVVERIGEIRGQGSQSQVLVRSSQLKPGTEVVVTQLPNAMNGLLTRVAAGGS